MFDYAAYSRKGALLDTNLLTVLLVSQLGSGEVEKFKRTQAFTTDDAKGIEQFLELFGWICTTSHVIAETSNLIDFLAGEKQKEVKQLLSFYVKKAQEYPITSTELVDTPIYYTLGITDAGLFSLSTSNGLVLVTADLPLYHYAANLGVEVVNFNHLRTQWLL